MVEQKLNGNKILYYESKDEMPIKRFKEYTKYLLIDSGIGSSAEEVGTHISQIIRFIEKGDKDNARQQTLNLWQNINLLLSGQNPKINALMCLVAKVNGEDQNDISTDGLNRLSDQLSNKGLTWGKVKTWIDSVKKKLKLNLNTIFPKRRTRN